MPEGSGLQVERERDLITRRVSELGDRVRVVSLEGRVTPNRLRKVLNSNTWDILHFAGHARSSPDEEVEVRLNSEDTDFDDFWMEAETFASLFNSTTLRLVVMNCCRAASVYKSTRPVSGLALSSCARASPRSSQCVTRSPTRSRSASPTSSTRALLTGPETARGRSTWPSRAAASACTRTGPTAPWRVRHTVPLHRPELRAVVRSRPPRLDGDHPISWSDPRPSSGAVRDRDPRLSGRFVPQGLLRSCRRARSVVRRRVSLGAAARPAKACTHSGGPVELPPARRLRAERTCWRVDGLDRPPMGLSALPESE